MLLEERTFCRKQIVKDSRNNNLLLNKADNFLKMLTFDFNDLEVEKVRRSLQKSKVLVNFNIFERNIF